MSQYNESALHSIVTSFTFHSYDPVDKIVLEKHHVIKGNPVNVEKALPKDQTNRARMAASNYAGGGGGGGGGGGMRGPPSRSGGGWGPMGGESQYGGDGGYRSGGGGGYGGMGYGNRSDPYGGGYSSDMGGGGNNNMMGFGGSAPMGGGGGGYGMGGPNRGGYDDGECTESARQSMTTFRARFWRFRWIGRIWFWSELWVIIRRWTHAPCR